MKKTLFTLAALTAASATPAQSSMTLFGVVDASLSGYTSKSEERHGPTQASPFPQGRAGARVSRTVLANSGYNSSRLGFRGTEDLGGGLAAHFWLESAIANDDGATGISTFGRRSTLSLAGAFGEVRVGRDYTPSFWNDAVFDPFGPNGVGASLLLTAQNVNTSGGVGGFGGNTNYVRASNSIGYFLPPNLGGFYGQAMYAFHENNSYAPGTATPPGVNAVGGVNAGVVAAARAGRYMGGRFGYIRGALDVAIGYGSSTAADNFYLGTTDIIKTANLGASYDFGPVKLFGELARVTNARVSETGLGARSSVSLAGYLLGVSVPIGPGLLRAAYQRVKYDQNAAPAALDSTANKLALGYVHNLSKRTALYATAARVRNHNGASLTVGGPAFISNATFASATSTGYDLGVRHAF